MKAAVSFLCATMMSSAFAQETSTCVGEDRFSFETLGLLTFSEAQTSCTGQGGNLARITNEEEFAVVQALTGGKNAWIGVDARVSGGNGDPSQFSFTDGISDGVEFFQVPIGTEPWAAGEPNGVGGIENCVHLNTNSLWNDLPCDYPLNFVCRVVNDPICLTASPTVTPTTQPSETPTAQPSVSPSKLSYITGPSTCTGGDRFVFDNLESFTFEDAQTSCTGEGGNLARITSEMEFAIVQALTGGKNAWIGVDARVSGGNGDPSKFSFTDGVTNGVEFFQVPIGDGPWEAGEPNDAAGVENCVHMNTNSLWNDLPCDYILNYVCRIVNDPACN